MSGRASDAGASGCDVRACKAGLGLGSAHRLSSGIDDDTTETTRGSVSDARRLTMSLLGNPAATRCVCSGHAARRRGGAREPRHVAYIMLPARRTKRATCTRVCTKPAEHVPWRLKLSQAGIRRPDTRTARAGGKRLAPARRWGGGRNARARRLGSRDSSCPSTRPPHTPRRKRAGVEPRPQGEFARGRRGGHVEAARCQRSTG